MKKRILLIQPENREINAFRKKQLNNFVQITMPYLAAFIDETRYVVTLVDEYNQKIPFGSGFDLVAVTVNTPNAPHCYEISHKFREKGAKVVFGGPHATLLPDEAEKHCDYLVIGESEDTWPRFLEDFYLDRADSRYVSDAPAELKNLPVPRWDLLRHRTALMKGAVFASRGCPYNCRYCNLKQIYPGGIRTRPVDEVVNEINLLKTKHFVFWDDNFFADKSYALRLMKAVSPLKKRWAAQVTLRDCDDDELLRAARAAGCLYLFVGLESFSDASLRDAGKEINLVGAYEKIIQKLHQNRIMIQAGIVFGFDSDGPDVFRKTLEACKKIGIDGATVSVLSPLPGTPVYRQFQEEGRLSGDDWSLYDGKTQVAFSPRNMTAQELFDGYVWFRKEFYSLASFIRRILVSRTHFFYNAAINLGYRSAIRRR